MDHVYQLWPPFNDECKRFLSILLPSSPCRCWYWMMGTATRERERDRHSGRWWHLIGFCRHSPYAAVSESDEQDEACPTARRIHSISPLILVCAWAGTCVISNFVTHAARQEPRKLTNNPNPWGIWLALQIDCVKLGKKMLRIALN